MPGRIQLDGYVRVSRVGGRGGDSFISPDVQREQIERWAQLRDVDIVAWHEDLDQSGGKLHRPGLDALLQRIRSHQTGGVAVARLDRLSRASVPDALNLMAEIDEEGGQVVVIDLGVDPTTPMGEFASTVLLAVARMTRRQLTEMWALSTERAIRRGVHGHIPFGYRKHIRGQPLEPCPTTAPLVRGVFAMRASGAAWTAIARWLDDAGAPPKRGREWTRRAVENIVANRAYLGEARYGQHVNPDAHPALVTLDQFEAAQHVRAARPPRGEPALLSGLVRCAGCRHRMHAATVGSRYQRVYRCKRRHGAGECPAPASVDRELLDQLVTDQFLEHYSDIAVEGRIASPGLAAARQRLSEAEAELAAYRDNTRARDALLTLGEGHFEAGLESRVAAVVTARDALEGERLTSVGIDLSATGGVWPELSVEERRRLLTEGVDAVFLRRAAVTGRSSAGLDPGRVRIFWRGEAPHDLPGPGIRTELRSLDW